MTNLIEKSLLIGFGIFTLAIFSSIIFPFLGAISEFNQNGRNELETYIDFINEIDQGVHYIIQSQDEDYLKEIDYPSNININFYDKTAKFEFLIENQLCIRIKEYSKEFINRDFIEISPGKYILNISSWYSLINVNIKYID